MSMSRSQSAAPSFLQQSRGVGPPPGLSGDRSSSMGMGGGSHSRDMGASNTIDHYGLTRQQAGLRRPASAGLIGEEHDTSSVLASLGIESNSNSGAGAVRPAPKTLMDLIKEDTPPPPRNGQTNDFANYNAAGLGITRSHTAGPSFYDERSGYGDRARTASPLSSHLDSLDRFDRNDNFKQRPEPMRYPTEQMGGLTQQMDRMQVGPGGGPGRQQYPVPQPTRVSIVQVFGSISLKDVNFSPFFFFPLDLFSGCSAPSRGPCTAIQDHACVSSTAEGTTTSESTPASAAPRCDVSRSRPAATSPFDVRSCSWFAE